MELRFEKKPVSCLRRDLWQSQDREFTQELRLGDEMPEIGSVLSARGQYVMRGKEWHGDSVGVNGGVMVWILYAPADGDRPQCVEAWIPVQAKWNLSGSEREGTIRASWLLRGVDARCISARKLMVRADLSLLAEAMEPWETEVYVPERLDEDIQLLRRSYPTMIPKETGEKPFQLEEELEISNGNAAKICAMELSPELSEQKVLGDKVVFRGDLKLHLLCQNSEGQLFAEDLTVPFSQFAELDRDYDKAATVCVMMAVSAVEPELVEGKLGFKCGLVAQYMVWDQLMLELVEDAYSLSRSVTPNIGRLALPMELDRCRNTLYCQTVLPGDVSRVVDTWAGPAQPRIRRAGGLTELELWGNMGILYMDGEGQLRGGNGQWSTLWELPTGEDATAMAQVVEMTRPEASLVGDITLGMDVTAQVLTAGRDGLPMVQSLELGERNALDPSRPSVILRRAGEETLWELAKSSGSTVDAIRRANGLEEEPVDDRILLIPVC